MAENDIGKNNTANVSTTRGIKGGYAFCAPVGTTLPTDYETPLDAAFKNVGYISSDGWKEGLDGDSDNITDMNGDVVDSYDSSFTETLGMTLLEIGDEALAVQYGHDNVTDEDGMITVDHNWGNAGEYLAWVLELVLKNGRRWRKVIRSAKRTDLGEFQGNATTPAGREITLTYQTDANGSGCKDYIQSTETSKVAPQSDKALEDMSIEELKAYAAAHDIDITGKTLKADILQAIIDAEEVE